MQNMDMEKKMLLVKCPNCGSFNTAKNSKKAMYALGGMVLIIAGGLSSFFIVGIPILLIGFVCLIISFFIKGTGEMKCRGCQFQFVDEDMANAEKNTESWFKFRLK